YASRDNADDHAKTDDHQHRPCSRMQGERRDRAPPLPLPDQFAIDTTRGEPVPAQDIFRGEPGNQAHDDDVHHRPRHAVLFFQLQWGWRRRRLPVLLVVLPEFILCTLGNRGRDGECHGVESPDYLVGNVEGMQYQRAVGAGLVCAAFKNHRPGDGFPVWHFRYVPWSGGRPPTTGALHSRQSALWWRGHPPSSYHD